MIYFKDMGVPEKWGRLCNQFFEIAAATALAIENNDIAIFPEWKYNKYFKNGIKTDNVNNFRITSEYNEFGFYYKKIPYTRGMNLNGFFQSEKHFEKYKNEIRNIFELKEEYEFLLKNKWNEELKNSVSIHVRRTDYVQSESVGGIHVCPTINYFEAALKFIEEKYKIDNILVFSDDMKWCKNNFKGDRYIFIENQNEIEDLYLMSYCDHNITTNSTYSWWGSWLNKNENKIVTIPSRWFNRSFDFYADLYRGDMIKFEN